MLNRRRFIQVSSATAGIASGPWSKLLHAQSPAASPSSRSLFVYADKRLGNLGSQCIERTIAAANRSPLLSALAQGKPPQRLNVDLPQNELQPILAYNHLLVFALPGDPLLEQVWQMEAKFSGNLFHVFGFGDFRGSLGYIESDRNPFLHAAAVIKAPYECEAITVTGTNAAGLEIAADALLTKSLVNGVVAQNGAWSRVGPTLLDRDPLPATFQPPAGVPPRLESLERIAWTHSGEDVYRRVLQDTNQMPESIWLAKYYRSGQWDDAGLVGAFHDFAAGLHRRAYGNAILAIGFANAGAASTALPLIAKAAGLQGSGEFRGFLPPFAWAADTMGDSNEPGTLRIWAEGASVFIASVLAPVPAVKS